MPTPLPLPQRAELVLRGGRLIDPAQNIDAITDIAISGGRILALGAEAAAMPTRSEIDARGAIVIPGCIDMHVHVYEWVTNFGVPADAAGIHAGATTIVDQGSSGAWTIGGFKAFIADPAVSDVRAFVSVNVAGALQGGMEGPILHNPGMAHLPSLLQAASDHPHLVRGIKCHGESGALSHWGTEVLAMAAQAGRSANLPLYIHTGELFPVIEASRPAADAVMRMVLPHLKPGDVLAHVYSSMPDGIMGPGDAVPDWMMEARERGVLFDLGHGINFSFEIARKMMAKGIYPDTLGSDVHGDFCANHDFSILDYSLFGGLNKLVALGMPLMAAVRALTETPAKVLDDPAIGHLRVGARANITMMRAIPGAWSFVDCRGERLDVRERLLPELVVMDGQPIRPDCGLLADIISPSERPRGITRAHLPPRPLDIAAQ